MAGSSGRAPPAAPRPERRPAGRLGLCARDAGQWTRVVADRPAVRGAGRERALRLRGAGRRTRHASPPRGARRDALAGAGRHARGRRLLSDRRRDAQSGADVRAPAADHRSGRPRAAQHPPERRRPVGDQQSPAVLRAGGDPLQARLRRDRARQARCDARALGADGGCDRAARLPVPVRAPARSPSRMVRGRADRGLSASVRLHVGRGEQRQPAVPDRGRCLLGAGEGVPTGPHAGKRRVDRRVPGPGARREAHPSGVRSGGRARARAHAPARVGDREGGCAPWRCLGGGAWQPSRSSPTSC